MPEQTAASKVLLTVELAEQILTYLPFHDLTRAELVCRSWQDIIAWSPALRQGLFLEPSPHALSMAYQSNSKLRIKPWQFRHLNIKRYIETYTIAVLHPYLRNDPIKERTGVLSFTLSVHRALKLDPSRRWRKMFVTQPPCRNVKIEYQIGVPNAIFTGRDHVTNTNGVRLGLLVGRLRQLLANPGDRGDLQPMPTATFEGGRAMLPSAWFERVDCFVEGFISEGAASALASKAAEGGKEGAEMGESGGGSGRSIESS